MDLGVWVRGGAKKKSETPDRLRSSLSIQNKFIEHRRSGTPNQAAPRPGLQESRRSGVLPDGLCRLRQESTLRCSWITPAHASLHRHQPRGLHGDLAGSLALPEMWSDVYRPPRLSYCRISVSQLLACWHWPGSISTNTAPAIALRCGTPAV